MRGVRLLAAAAGLVAVTLSVPALAADPSPSVDASPSASPSGSPSASPSPSASRSAGASPSGSASASPSPSSATHRVRMWFDPSTAAPGTTTTLVVAVDPLPQGGRLLIYSFAEGLQEEDCTVTDGPGSGCGYVDPDDQGNTDYYVCVFAPSAEPARCTWSLSVDRSAPRGRTHVSGYFVPQDGGPTSWAVADLTIGTTSARPSASVTAPRPSRTSSGGLPVTGTSLPLYGGLAALLLGAGAGMVILARRRTRSAGR
ncbi:MAG TPA: hypothetical protein VGN37_19245 [Actinocatenispora sp.]